MVAAETNAPLLRVRELRTEFDTPGGAHTAVDGVSFDIRPGEVVGVVGESGSGKTMVALSILGLLPEGARLAGGEVWFEERDLVRLEPRELRSVRGGGIGMIFQEPMTAFDPLYSIGEQIAESVRSHLGMGRAAAHARAVELLDTVGLPDAARRYHDYPHHQSGGMLQRAMIAMALAPNPRLLIADEPTTALDVTIQAQILELFAGLQRETGVAALFVSHDLGVIAEIAGTVLVMYAGQVVERAPTPRIFDAPAHPYTRALLSARPRLHGDATPLRAIRGQAPSLGARPSGCPFHPRCDFADDSCVRERPPHYEVGETHLVACHLYGARRRGTLGGDR